MMIGKRGAATTAISAARPDHVTVRGRDLADLMGKTSFTEFFFLLVTGRLPSEDQRFFLDLSLIAIAEHGLTPSVRAARMTFAADPAALQGVAHLREETETPIDFLLASKAEESILHTADQSGAPR